MSTRMSFEMPEPKLDRGIRAVGNPIKISGWEAALAEPPLLGERNASLLGATGR